MKKDNVLGLILGVILFILPLYYWLNLSNWFPDLYRTHGMTSNAFLEQVAPILLFVLGLFSMYLSISCFVYVIRNKVKEQEK
jgi:hypothetical protein